MISRKIKQQHSEEFFQTCYRALYIPTLTSGYIEHLQKTKYNILGTKGEGTSEGGQNAQGNPPFSGLFVFWCVFSVFHLFPFFFITHFVLLPIFLLSQVIQKITNHVLNEMVQ